MYKVVYNDCFGGFSLSVEAVLWLRENGHGKIQKIAKTYQIEPIDRTHGCHLEDIERHDPDFVRCVETLGERASGAFANLKVYKLNGNRYRITEYDGLEEVYEPEYEVYITIE